MDQKPILETIDPEIMTRLATRREAIKKGAATSGAVVAGLKMMSVPIALAALSRDVFAQSTPAIVIDVLQFALTLENLESEFYKAVLGTATGTGATAQNDAFASVRSQVNAEQLTTLQQISKHEIAHVNFLRGQITLLGATPLSFTPSSFDFTGGNGSGTGPFAPATNTLSVLFAAAQTFEDTGVRAYKGQAGFLVSNKDVLDAALQIHSVEARHAAQIRRLRGIKSWINGNNAETGLSGAAQTAINLSYAGEENKTHKGVDITALGVNNGGDAAVTAAFDEPLTKDQVINIVKDFIIGSTP